MSLTASIRESKTISKWFEYTDSEEKKLASFKIRNADYRPYQSALERARNHQATRGFNVKDASETDKLYDELLLEAAAYYLIEDWDGITFREIINGKVVETEQGYSQENAAKLLNMGDLGTVVWMFVLDKATKMQDEINARQAEILGKSKSSTIGAETE